MSSILNHVNDDFIETYKLTVNETFFFSKPTEMSRGCSNRHWYLVAAHDVCLCVWPMKKECANAEFALAAATIHYHPGILRRGPWGASHITAAPLSRVTCHVSRVTCHVSRVSTPALTYITIWGFVVKKVFQWKTAFQNEGTNTITCNTEHLYSVQTL